MKKKLGKTPAVAKITLGLVFAALISILAPVKARATETVNIAVIQPAASVGPTYTEEDLRLLAILVTNEAGGIDSKTEKSQVVWSVLNRVDSPEWPDTIQGVISQSGQYAGYRKSGNYFPDCYEISRDVLNRWLLEKSIETSLGEGANPDVGRTLPKTFLYFNGANGHNHFKRTENGETYSGGLESPYDS